jgi:hypothetical protein
MTQYWFKAKTHGYGATPSTWQGWAATAVFVALIVATSLLLLPLQPNWASGPPAWQILGWVLVVAALTIGFVWLARAKTDGQWGWRWGK